MRHQQRIAKLEQQIGMSETRYVLRIVYVDALTGEQESAPWYVEVARGVSRVV